MSTSTQVYVQDKLHGWLPASVVSSDSKISKVKVLVPNKDDDDNTQVEREVKLSDYPGGTLPLQNVNENGNPIQMPDMCDLPYLHEAAIVYNLRARHREKIPYTRVGDIVIAVNPFQWIADLYSDEKRESYAEKLIWGDSEGDALSSIPPHVYESSSLAYRGLAVDGQDQAILVSGESGAGKTETVKIVMSHLASVQSSTINTADSGTSDGAAVSQVIKRVLDSNPLLEAFGNAKTTRNDNSSRFGKYIQLQFDVEDATTAAFSGRSVPSCILAGSFCETYLLEKTRVVIHEQPERSYHIFYQILAAPEAEKKAIWNGLANSTLSTFKYIGETETLKIEGKTDAQHWERTVKALKLIGVDGEKFVTLMRAVCTVLQLGNLTFAKDPTNDENSIINSPKELSVLADLMGVAEDDVNKALTSRTVVAGKEVYTVPLNLVDAKDTCNAFAKEIYQQIFDWLVKSINAATSAEKNYADNKDVDEYGLIGLLDIFGFESFKVNRFEQLCINYANEKLQQKYTIDIFRSVQEEYEFEGIELGEVAFSDNVEVLKLVEGRMGLVAVLNEECVRPKGNDNSFVSKVKTMNKDLSCLIQDRLHRPEEFAVEHYAGVVKYDATNFVQKNMDSIPKDLLDCACKSTNLLISKELKAAADGKQSVSKRGKKSSLTVATKFRQQLTELMTNISKTKTRYIRCIKPNPEKKPIQFNLSSSVLQLRCAGVVAAVTISRVAFPNRLTHETVILRFQCLSSKKIIEGEEKKDDSGEESPLKGPVDILLTDLLKAMEVTEDGKTTKAFVMGKSRVYFRSGALEYLENKRLVALGVLATSIQRIIRGFVAVSKFATLKNTSITLQAYRRRTKARNDYIEMRMRSIMLACWTRRFIAKAKLLQLKKENRACKIQSRWRMVKALVAFLEKKSAAITIQKISRGSMQRPKYKMMVVEAAEEARVNSKLAALQKRLADAEMKWIQADKARIAAEKKAAGAQSGPETKDETDLYSSVQNQEISSADGRNEEESTLKGISLQQKALIDESGKMLEYLRDEVFKIRGKNYLLRTDLNELKETNHTLTEHNASMTASFEALKQHANQLSKTNMKLIVDSATHKEIIAKLRNEVKNAGYSSRTEVSKLREELKRKEMIHAEEIAKLKKELGVKKSKQSNKKEKPSKQETSSLKKYATYNKTGDGEEEWGQEYYSNNNQSNKKGRIKNRNNTQPNRKSGRGGSTGGPSKSAGGRGNPPSRKSNPKRPISSNNTKLSGSSNTTKSSGNNTNNSRAPPQAQSSLKAKSSLASARSSLAAAASDPRPQQSNTAPKLIASSRSLANVTKKTSSLSKAAGK